ncbi:MAG TPA: hypothetical protein VFN10_17135 [Thermoanaerobaculia bacterium]|nr:hypothetical protein [Thermoanaerobaculia bacterium]
MAAVLMMATFLPSLRAAVQPADCPGESKGGASFQIVTESGSPVVGAQLSFTADNWDSTLIQWSSPGGMVDVECVVAGEGYDVTIYGRDTAVLQVSADASPHPLLRRVILPQLRGPSIRVMHEGSPVPRARLRITGADGSVQDCTSDRDGFVRAHVSSKGDTEIDVTLAGFFPQHARFSEELMTRAIVFDLSMTPVR